MHPPGGVVGGDELRIDVQVDAGAHALITTPAATKFYRCDGRMSSQTQELRAAGATLEWLPQENIFYRGADARTATRVHVDAESRFIGWEINCLGLPARGEPFDAGALRLDLELWRSRGRPPTDQVRPHLPGIGTVPIFVDRLRLDGRVGRARRALGPGGPGSGGHLVSHAGARATTSSRCASSSPTARYAAVSLVDGVLVLRALAPQAEAVRNLFIAAWQRLRPAHHRPRSGAAAHLEHLSELMELTPREKDKLLSSRPRWSPSAARRAA